MRIVCLVFSAVSAISRVGWKGVRVSRAYADQSIHAQTIIPFVYQCPLVSSQTPISRRRYLPVVSFSIFLDVLTSVLPTIAEARGSGVVRLLVRVRVGLISVRLSGRLSGSCLFKAYLQL